jgi:hypothetical protein
MLTRERQLSIIEDLGLNSNHRKKWYRKYRNLVGNAVQRDAECLLSFRQYLKLAIKAQLFHPDLIGRTAGKFVMGRLGDMGNYEWGNCRFITVEQNRLEKDLYGGTAAMALAKTGRNSTNDISVRTAAAKRRGRNKFNHEGVARMAENKRGRNKNNDPGVCRMSQKLKGRTKFTSEGLAQSADKQSLDYHIVSPTGKVYKGRNVKEFCVEHGLQPGCLAGVLRGVRNHHKGWTGHYV